MCDQKEVGKGARGRRCRQQQQQVNSVLESVSFNKSDDINILSRAVAQYVHLHKVLQPESMLATWAVVRLYKYWSTLVVVNRLLRFL